MRIGQVVFAAVMVLSPAIVSGTTLVGIWTEHQITIASDSKQTLIGPEQQIVGYKTTCKIFEAGDGLVFAFAGLANAESIDVVEAVRNAYPSTASETGKQSSIDDTLMLSAAVALMKTLQARHYAPDPAMNVGMIIAGQIDGKLEMIRIGEIVTNRYTVSTTRFVYPKDRGHDGSDPNRGIEIIGRENAIKRLRSASSDWRKGKDKYVASKLVTLETQDPQDSQFVGLPISEIIVTKRGMRWVSRGACE